MMWRVLKLILGLTGVNWVLGRDTFVSIPTLLLLIKFLILISSIWVFSRFGKLVVFFIYNMLNPEEIKHRILKVIYFWFSALRDLP